MPKSPTPPPTHCTTVRLWIGMVIQTDGVHDGILTALGSQEWHF